MSNVSSSNSQGVRVPKLRFPGFEGEWKEKAMDDIFEEVIEKSRPDLPVLSILQGVGTVLRDNFDRRISYDKANLNSYKAMKKGDFIIHLRSFEGGLECSKHNGISSPAYKILRTNCLVSAAYEDYFRSYNFIQGKLSIAVTGIRDGKSIDMPSFWTIKIAMPNIAEQNKIASFLSLLNKRIEKQQQLVEALKSYKRGVIEHYFSRQIILTDPTEKWSKCHIKDCLNYEQPQKYIVTTEHYSNEYLTPVLTANKAFVLGYTDETDGIYDKGQVIIYDDFTMEAKFVEFPFKVKSSTIKMLTPKNGNNLYFLFCLLQHLQLKPEGHQRSYISIVEQMDVSIPSIKEQNRASELFYTLNRLVKCEEGNLTHIESEKAGLLGHLFI